MKWRVSCLMIIVIIVLNCSWIGGGLLLEEGKKGPTSKRENGKGREGMRGNGRKGEVAPKNEILIMLVIVRCSKNLAVNRRFAVNVCSEITFFMK